MEAIYRKNTYKFEVDIKVNGVAVNVSSDTATVFIDKEYNSVAPKINKAGDCATYGATGKVLFELTPEETTLLEAGSNILQVKWLLFGTTKTFIVATETIQVLNQVDNSPVIP